jgi:hypothetical protein
VPLVHVACVGGAVQPVPGAVITALVNTPAVTVTVAVDPVQPSLKLLKYSVPVPETVPELMLKKLPNPPVYPDP